MTIHGVVAYAGPIEARGQKGFKVQTVIISQDEVSRNAEIPVDFMRDLLKESIHLTTGDRVKVEVELHGRQWNDRWFTSIEAKSFVVTQAADPQPNSKPENSPPPVEDEELPF